MKPLGHFYFQNNQYTVQCPYKFFPSNDILIVYPFKYIGNPCSPCLKIGQGHHRIMIYTYIVVLESSMLHAKFLRNPSTGSGEEDF